MSFKSTSCTRKVKYRKDSAKKAAERMTQKLGEQMESYWCRYCGGWHIGHSLLELPKGRVFKFGPLTIVWSKGTTVFLGESE